MKKILTLILGFTLLVSANIFAQGDDCASATNAVVGPNGAPAATPTFNPNTQANTSPSCDGIDIDYDTWFSFVSPASGIVNIEEVMTTGSGDFEIAVYSGACGALVEVFCNNSTFEFAHRISGLNQGQTYYIQVFAE